jgi:murein DD-endopeptidase MepM/ murein hydrolase activator NlpD
VKRVIIAIIILVCLLPLKNATGQGIQPPPDSPEDIGDVETAIRQVINIEREYIIGLITNSYRIEDTNISNEGDWAVAWLVLIDPETNEPVPTEPGLVIAKRIGTEWRVWLPTSDGWLDMVKAVPVDALPAERKQAWIDRVATHEVETPDGPLTGYLLPWEAGKTVRLTQSTCHDAYITSGNAHHAFDFSIYKVLWDIYASKAGKVWLFKDDVPTCYKYTCSDEQAIGNYIVIRDDTTDPVTYQLYLHLKQGSIPAELKKVNEPIAQGQFIGVVDNTGQSWGHHLHFQVQVPIWGEQHYWGRSVDISFSDVDINGGRPRVKNSWCNDQAWCTRDYDVCVSFRDSYVSGNTITTDTTPPEGDLLEPINGFKLNEDLLHIEGWALDEGSGIDEVQIMARYNGSWHDIGPVHHTSIFSYTWNLCTDNVPQGPVSLALKITDQQGNQAAGYPGLRHFIYDYACPPQPPPPTCIPSDNYIAVFADRNYQGSCSLLGPGDYPNSALFGAVGDDNAESILSGTNVKATLFSANDYQGRSETIENNDSNLADNRIGINSLSSFKVRPVANTPTPPASIFPGNSEVFTDRDSLSLVWKDTRSGTQFQATLDGPSGTKIRNWDPSTYWHLGTLITGTYTWTVRAQNSAGTSDWNPTKTFVIQEASTAIPAAVTAPFSDTLEGTTDHWTTTGLWHLADDQDKSHSHTHSWWYASDASGNYETGTLNFGDLTSPPITLPITSAAYALQFWYRSLTEGSAPHWDQRWVQISVDGEPFTNTYQLYNDPQGEWLRATINLSPYYTGDAIHTIQVRFHFATMDDLKNLQAGWYIDDIQVAAFTPPTCNQAYEPNDNPSQATAITYGTTRNGAICPGGDIDIFSFSGLAGDRTVVDIDAKSIGSDLDPILFLLDNDGSSVLAEHDDEILYVKQDPHMGYVLPRDGTYYLKLHAWGHPYQFGEYSLRLFTDDIDPSIAMTNPKSNAFIPQEKIILSVNANDSLSGISHVQFFWHSGDWENDDWVEVKDDWEGSNGWSVEFDATSLAEQGDIAFYAQAYDWAGNWAAAGAWNLTLDLTPPVTTLDALETPSESTAIHLTWSATDNLSGVDRFQFRFKEAGTSWPSDPIELDDNMLEYWYIGQASTEEGESTTYKFQIRAIDKVGNSEAYNETQTTIPEADTLCSSPDQYDDFTANPALDDNSPAKATTISASGVLRSHNFCNPLSADRLNDEDWHKFSASKGQSFVITTVPQDESTAVVISLYDTNGTTLIKEAKPETFGQRTHMEWTAPKNGVFYIKLHHTDGRVAGNGVVYEVLLAERWKVFLPVMMQAKE